MSSIHPDIAATLREIWSDYRPTPLLELPALARIANVARVFVKNEAERPLGNFKALGGMIAGLRALATATGAGSIQKLLSNRLPEGALPRLVCASDGNHGLAVAAAAKRAGAKARVYLPIGVSQWRADRIEAHGAEVAWIEGTYDDAVNAASAAAASGEGLLIADTTADPDDAVVKDVMAGYSVLAQELIAQFKGLADLPTHMFMQAGVGGLAAAMADGLRSFMRAPGMLLVVEPASAACVARALEVGHPVLIPGDLHTSAEMLSCGIASAPALEILQRHAARSVVVAEDELRTAIEVLREAGGPQTSASGAAGVAGLLSVAANPELRAAYQLRMDSSVLLAVTEGSRV